MLGARGSYFLFNLLIVFALQPAQAIHFGKPGNDLNTHRSIVAIRYPAHSYEMSFCTATKIAKGMFLTAAHCLDNFDRRDRTVRITRDSKATPLKKVDVLAEIESIYVNDVMERLGVIRSPQRMFNAKSQVHISNDLLIFTIRDESDTQAIKDLPSQSLSRRGLRQGERVQINGYGQIFAGVLREGTWGLLHYSPQKVSRISEKTFQIKKNSRAKLFSLGLPGDSGSSVSRRSQDGRFEVVGVISESKGPRVRVNGGYAIEVTSNECVDINKHRGFIDAVMNKSREPSWAPNKK